MIEKLKKISYICKLKKYIGETSASRAAKSAMLSEVRRGSVICK